MQFTQAAVNGLKLPAGKKDHIEFDDTFKGFGVRIREGGSRKWIYQYKLAGKTNRLVIGLVDALDLKQAKRIAGEHHAKVVQGINPAQDRRDRLAAQANLFGHVIDDFLKQYKNRPRTVQLTASYLRKTAAPLHSRPVDGITHADVAKLLRDVEASSGAATCNRLRSALSQVFTWGIGEALCASNPVAHTNRRQEKPRERVLSVEELRAIWRATDDSAFGTIVRLLILTAQRRGEVSGMCREEIKDGIWTIPAARSKNGKAHYVPLADTAQRLASRAPFPAQNWSGCKTALDAASGVTGWTLHDLRRTAATMMAQDLKVAPHIVEAILNHSPGKLVATYNRADYREEKRAALEAWDQQIQKVVY
jgi:integrase